MNVLRSPSCACGSGLSRLRCCDLDLSAVAPAAANAHLLPQVERAIACHRQGAIAEAEKLCLEVLEQAPGQGGALALLYQIRKAQGFIPAAEVLVRRLMALEPGNIWAIQELALLLFSRLDLAQAEGVARHALRMSPTDPQSHNLMGMILTEGQRPRPGEFHYRRALELLRHRQPILLANLAWNLKAQGRIAEARALYEESTSSAPDVLLTLLGWARTEEADGRFSRAEELLDQAQAIAPGHPSVLLLRAIVRGRAGDRDGALAIIEALDRQGADARLSPWELLEKGRLLDEMGRHDAAFAAFSAGKRRNIALNGTVYVAADAAQIAGRMREFFTAPRLRVIPRARAMEGEPRPIFILGFPGSGASVLEGMLAAHPKISAGHELALMQDCANVLPRMLNSPLAYPEALAELWMGDRHEGLDHLRDHYIQRVRRAGILGPGATRFTDRTLFSEMHMGLMALMFPEAPLVHLLRHPLDVVLSVYSRQMAQGFHFANELESIARHYVLVMDLADHYRREAAIKYVPVRYEDLLADPEPHMRRILGFADLPFDRRCLKPAGASEPEGGAAVRYRPYLKHLAPVIPILEPLIQRMGYTVDG